MITATQELINMAIYEHHFSLHFTCFVLHHTWNPLEEEWDAV